MNSIESKCQNPNFKIYVKRYLKFHQDFHSGPEKNCLKKKWGLPFLEIRCNIFETIYFNSLSLKGEGKWRRREEL